MADEVYDGAIGIDLGKSLARRWTGLFEQFLIDRRHDLLLCSEL
jgi:hypothetical protein